jgi:probable phosphoglycerate mutase
MSHIVLIRPGCTDFDEQQRIQGTLDLPLSTRGEQQVQIMLQELQHVPLDLIYTSPTDPARTTATILGTSLGVTVRLAEGLRNLNLGLWQGLQVEEIRHKHPKVFKQWLDAPETIYPPEGEMVSETFDRIQQTLERPLRKKGNLAIVAPEPLATLIRCWLVSGKPEHTELYHDRAVRLWELLIWDGQHGRAIPEELVAQELATL